jgi:hypothetical protein
MPTRSSRITIEESGLDAWISGLEKFGDADADAEIRWRQATEVFFDRSQQAVHVISGDLKGSGEMNTSRTLRTLVGEVVYGDTPECDYAAYEFARGGSHDALQIAYVATERVFEQTLAEIMEDEVASWL